MIQHLYEKFLSSNGVSTDTRKIESGCIFFALKGDNFNGNRFAADAIANGAAWAVIDEAEFQTENTILVDDVLTSLQELARYHRDQLKIPVIGLTGSNGKTTTKELIAAALRVKYEVFATHGNLNNHIGVPLSVLSVNDSHQIAIIEMGANHQKEIAFLCTISKPDMGMITNIGRAHLEGFGGPEGVKKGKKELYDFLEANNRLVFLNEADDVLKGIRPDTEVIGYGGEAKITGDIIDDSAMLSIVLTSGSGIQQIQSNLVGGYNLNNILAAAAIASHFGLSLEEIKEGIENYHPTNNRSQFIKTERNQVILDAYNANPSSVEAALRNFAKRDDEHKLVILGDMLELGEASLKEHRQIAELITELDLTAVLVGAEFQNVDQSSFKTFPDSKSTLAYLQEQNLSDHAILIKGSRGIKLETVVEGV